MAQQQMAQNRRNKRATATIEKAFIAILPKKKITEHIHIDNLCKIRYTRARSHTQKTAYPPAMQTNEINHRIVSD